MTIYCFLTLLVLCGGRPFLSTAQISWYTAAQGEDVSATFAFGRSGNWRIFCRNYCNTREDRVVVTSDGSANVGRYRVTYEEQYPQHALMVVGVSNVSGADSGLYRCVLEQWEGNRRTYYLYVDFWIQVDPAPPSPTPTDPSPYDGTTSSGPAGHQSCPTAAHGVVLYLALAVTSVIIVLVALSFLHSKRKANKQRPGTAERSPEPKTEDPSGVMYAEVDFSRSRSGGAPRCRAEAVIYSVPRVRTEEAPLYSAVSLPRR